MRLFGEIGCESHIIDSRPRNLIIDFPGVQGLRLLGLRPLPVLPRVRFLRNHVRVFARAAREGGSILEYGGSNLAEAVAGEDGSRCRLDPVLERRLGQQQVARAAHGFQCGHNLSSLNGGNEFAVHSS